MVVYKFTVQNMVDRVGLNNLTMRRGRRREKTTPPPPPPLFLNTPLMVGLTVWVIA